ncbi:MAG: LruC domain-containing protein [Bacteroidota bacterium]|jgi:LruC domain-containing protein
MKRFTIIISLLASAVLGFSQTVTNDFEQGSKEYYTNSCWSMEGLSMINNSPISGTWSIRSASLSGSESNANRMASPWVKLTASGNFTFKHKLTAFAGTWKSITVRLSNNTDTTTILLYTYNYVKPGDVNRVISVSVPVNVSGIYQVNWKMSGAGGGDDRIMLDDISIPGTYWSDPSEDCQPLKPVIVDSDKDGVPDDQDDYPNDKYRAYNNYYPASDTGTIAFEDNWPSYGDYDMNDLVMGYKFKVVSNASHNVVEVYATMILRANGASMNDGFGFQFPNVNPNSVISVTGTGNQTGYTIKSNGTETGNASDATFIVFDKSHRYMSEWNTIKTVAAVSAVPFNIYIKFMNNNTPGSGGAVNINTLNISGWNPFLVVNQQRGREIHLPNYQPTDMADQSLFRTGSDDTQPGIGKYYKSATNLPWALDIFGKFSYPAERQDISGAYLHFGEWVQSSGSSYPDWWSNTGGSYRKNSLIY